MKEAKFKSLLGNYDELFFDNGAPDGAGDFLGAGISLPFRTNDWWEMRDMWSYPYYSLNMMLEGGCGAYRNDEGFECELSYGNFFLTFPDIKQHYGPGKNQRWSELYVGFKGDIFDFYVNQRILPSHPQVWRLEKPEIWATRLRELLQQPRPCDRLETAQLMTQFLNFLFGMLNEATPVQSGVTTGDWFSQACRMLTNDLHHKIDYRQVAEMLGMSYHTFRAYFTKRAGMPPAQYRDAQRLKTACDLLINNPHKSCKQIAFTLGYYNGDHFSAQFKKQMGMPPNEYRKRINQELEVRS